MNLGPIRRALLTSAAVMFLTVCGSSANPALGAHSLTNYFLGAHGNLTISTPAMNTQVSGSTMLVCIGRGNISAFTNMPTDNKTNAYVQLGATHAYVPAYPDSGTALYAFSTAAGGSGHIVTAGTIAYDELTVDAVEIKNAGVIEDFKWNEVQQGHPLTSLNVTTTGPATLVAFWWGDGNQYFAHTAIPNNGFTNIDSILPIGSYVQSAVATKDVAAAGTYNVTWDSGGNEGAQLWLVAVQSAPAPILKAQVYGSDLVMSWPVSATNYNLETSSDLSANASWVSVSNAPVAVNSQNVITNTVSGPMRFYRLKKP